jgi:hypothetical protein
VSEPFFTGTSQVAIVVRDLDASLRTYVEDYGIGPWKIFEFNPGTGGGMIVEDAPVAYAMRVATTMVGDVEWELIEPLDDRSHYAQHLARHGESVHHVAVSTRDDYDEAMDGLRARGHVIRQGGAYKGATFAYMSTDRDLGVVTELVKWPPGTVHTPDRIYPPGATA